MSTPRDNLLRLLHRQGYDAVPYEFALCPHLIEVYHEKEGSSLPYDAYFGMPWKRLPDLFPIRMTAPASCATTKAWAMIPPLRSTSGA